MAHQRYNEGPGHDFGGRTDLFSTLGDVQPANTLGITGLSCARELPRLSMTSIEAQISIAPSSTESARTVSKITGIRKSWFWHLVNFSPFLLLIAFVDRFGVNVPLVDEWWLAHWFHAVHLGNGTMTDLFALNNEHRIAFPKLLWTPLAFLTHWNLRIEMMLHLLLALTIFVVFYLLSLRQTEPRGNALMHVANFSTSVLVFSFVQYGTWLWGINGAFLLVQATCAVAIWVCTTEKLRPGLRFSLAAFFCFVASFSSAHGLLSWLALFPCIFSLPMAKRPAGRLCLWMVLFALSAVIYSYHFKFPGFAGKATPVGLLDHPLQRASFFLALLGAPFCQSDATIPLSIAFTLGSTKHLVLLGAIVLAGLAGSVITLRKDPESPKITPWLSVALFGLLFAVMVTAGRGDSGKMAALQSRYITGSIFVPIAAIQLGRLARAPRLQRIYLVLVGALCLLVVLGSINALALARRLNNQLSEARLFVELIRYLDPVTAHSPQGRLFPLSQAVIRPQAELLDELGFLHLASDIVFEDQPSPDCGAFESVNASGNLRHLRQDNDEIALAGWASLPVGRGLPKVVLISYGNQKTFITGAVVRGVDRPDIAALRRDPTYIYSGWSVSFPAKFLPVGEGVLKAWVYDAAQKRFIPLPELGGEKTFRVDSK